MPLTPAIITTEHPMFTRAAASESVRRRMRARWEARRAATARPPVLTHIDPQGNRHQSTDGDAAIFGRVPHLQERLDVRIIP